MAEMTDVAKKKVKEKKSDKKPAESFEQTLTDAGLFSYASLCGLSLLQLFNEDHNEEFRNKTIKEILEHLQVPKQVYGPVNAIMAGEGSDDPQPFIDIIREEPVLQNTCLPLATDLMALAIKDGCYDARLRVLIKHVAWLLRVNTDLVEKTELVLAETLNAKHQEQYQMSEEEIKEKEKHSRRQKAKRFALIGLATIGGGTLIGLTGGLAAPLVAAGAGAIIGGAGAAALGSTAGVAIIGSLFGVAGAGLTGFKMKKRVGAVEEFSFEPLVFGGGLNSEPLFSKQLHITIAVTGWLTDEIRDFKFPWHSLAESKEQYCLRWESKYLLQMGKAIDYVLSYAMSMATQEALKYTILQGIIAAIAWPATLISVSNVIDNPWSVCIQRAVSAGKQLAEVLLAREQGKRPVTLMGYSLGARLIFSCLEELSKRKGSAGIIEDVILLGAPCTGDPKQWQPFSKVVAGKIINGYSRGDWLLKFLFRTASVHVSKIAGLGPVKWDDRRMHNVDLSEVVSGHRDYQKQLDTILKIVGVRTRSDINLVKPKVRNSSSDSYTSSEGGDESTNEITKLNLPDGEQNLSNIGSVNQTTPHLGKDANVANEISNDTSFIKLEANNDEEEDDKANCAIQNLHLDEECDSTTFVKVNRDDVLDCMETTSNFDQMITSDLQGKETSSTLPTESNNGDVEDKKSDDEDGSMSLNNNDVEHEQEAHKGGNSVHKSPFKHDSHLESHDDDSIVVLSESKGDEVEVSLREGNHNQNVLQSFTAAPNYQLHIPNVKGKDEEPSNNTSALDNNNSSSFVCKDDQETCTSFEVLHTEKK